MAHIPHFIPRPQTAPTFRKKSTWNTPAPTWYQYPQTDFYQDFDKGDKVGFLPVPEAGTAIMYHQVNLPKPVEPAIKIPNDRRPKTTTLVATREKAPDNQTIAEQRANQWRTRPQTAWVGKKGPYYHTPISTIDARTGNGGSTGRKQRPKTAGPTVGSGPSNRGFTGGNMGATMENMDRAAQIEQNANRMMMERSQNGNNDSNRPRSANLDSRKSYYGNSTNKNASNAKSRGNYETTENYNDENENPNIDDSTVPRTREERLQQRKRRRSKSAETFHHQHATYARMEVDVHVPRVAFPRQEGSPPGTINTKVQRIQGFAGEVPFEQSAEAGHMRNRPFDLPLAARCPKTDFTKVLLTQNSFLAKRKDEWPTKMQAKWTVDQIQRHIGLKTDLLPHHEERADARKKRQKENWITPEDFNYMPPPKPEEKKYTRSGRRHYNPALGKPYGAASLNFPVFDRLRKEEHLRVWDLPKVEFCD